MGFATKSSMMSSYTYLFSCTIMENKKSMGLDVPNDLSIEVYLTPQGILIEIVRSDMDSHSIDLEVIFSKLIKINRTDIKLENFSVEDFKHKDGWEDEE